MIEIREKQVLPEVAKYLCLYPKGKVILFIEKEKVS